MQTLKPRTISIKIWAVSVLSLPSVSMTMPARKRNKGLTNQNKRTIKNINFFDYPPITSKQTR